MNRGEFLAPNQFLQSSNGQYLASLQSNGILAIRHKSSNVVLWTSNRTINTAATMLALQYDRNLVILAGKTPIWSSDTANDEGDSTLVLKDDGNLELSDTRWSTGFKVFLNVTQMVKFVLNIFSFPLSTAPSKSSNSTNLFFSDRRSPRPMANILLR